MRNLHSTTFVAILLQGIVFLSSSAAQVKFEIEGAGQAPATKQEHSKDHAVVFQWLKGWWAIDSEATLDEIIKSVPNEKMQQQLLHNMCIFDFGFETEDEAAVFMMNSGHGEWNAVSGNKKQASIEIKLGGRTLAINVLKKDTNSVEVQPKGQPFRVVLKRMAHPVVQQNKIDAVCEPLKGKWEINLKRTAQVAEERGMAMSKKEIDNFKGMQFDYDGDKLDVDMGKGEPPNPIEWSPQVCEMSDGTEKAIPVYMVGGTNTGPRAPLSWTYSEKESIVTLGGMPLVFQKK